MSKVYVLRWRKSTVPFWGNIDDDNDQISLHKIAAILTEHAAIKNRKPSYGKVVQDLTILECENDELKRMLKGEREVAKDHANVINVARRLCNEGDEQIAALKRENKRLTDVLRYIQATRPYGIERAIDYQAWLTKRIGALLTAEESG